MSPEPLARRRQLRLYLIRHGLTEPTGPDSHSWPLSHEGRAQAEALAAASFWSQVTALYSSPEPRALATVEPAAIRHGLPVRQDARLSEVHRPGWIEEYDSAVRAFFEGRAQDGWEDRDEAIRRFSEAIRDLAREHAGGQVVLCSHGLMLALYVSRLMEVVPYALWRSIGFGQVAVVEDGELLQGFAVP